MSDGLQLRAKARRRRAEAEENTTDYGKQAMDTLIGGAETAATFASGLVAVPYAGAKAIAGEAYDFLHGDGGNLDKMVNTIEQTQQSLTYMPKTEEGKVILEGISSPFMWLEEKKKELGQWVTDATGSPELGAAAYTAPDALLMFLGTNPVKAQQMKIGAKDLQKKADELGLDLNASQQVQGEQLGEAARKMNTSGRGEASVETVDALVKAKEVGDRTVNMMYEKARTSPTAGVAVEHLRETLAPMIVESLEGYDLSVLPLVKARVNELSEIANKPWKAATINELEGWRKKINRMQPVAGDMTQKKALGTLKAQYDRFMEHQFVNDMIIGDKQAVQNWKLARQSRIRVGEMFEDNKIVQQLIAKEATPEQVRNLIFGSSEAGFAAQASGTIKSIKKIIGSDSEAMKALQNDAMLNIIDPLLSDVPDIAKFSKRYSDVVRKNQSVMRELFDNRQLKDMSEFAKAIKKHGYKGKDAAGILDKLTTFVSRMWVGHGIAKGQAKVGFTKGILDMLGASAGTSTRMKILQEILGYNPQVPLFPASAPARGAVLQAAAPEQEQDITKQPLN